MSATPDGSGGLPPAPPTPHHCYRHPDRETYVSCVRCERYICPDCMRPASVGFQCPEEISTGGRPMRRPARPASVGLGGRPGRPVVTQALVALCVVAFVLEGVPGVGLTSQVNSFTARFLLYGPSIAYDHQYYRLITAAFLHASVLHILFNTYALYLIGFQLEAVLGRVRYLTLFAVCALGGNAVSYLVHGVEANSLGASTAIFGFFAAFYLIARRLRLDTRSILVVVGINLVLTFLISDIDKWGHIGGLATGALMGLIYTYVPARRWPLQAALVVLVVAALVVAVVLRTSSITSASPI